MFLFYTNFHNSKRVFLKYLFIIIIQKYYNLLNKNFVINIFVIKIVILRIVTCNTILF